MRILAVLTVKNEGAFLVEWLSHHRAAGVTDFLVLSNDCADGTDAMLDRLEAMGRLVHLRNPAPHEGGVHFAGLKRADRHPLVAAADWIVPLDIDEFVTVQTGDRTIPALIGAVPGATAIALTWRLFGNDGVVGYEDRPVTERFVRAAPRELAWPWRAAQFKTLYRNDGTYRKLGVHRPRSPDPDRAGQARWVDGSGRALPAALARRGTFTPPGSAPYGLAQLNHYPLGAMESFVLKWDRGRSNHDDLPMTLDYWVERNWSAEEDRSALALAPARAALAAELMADARVAALHAEAVAWRRARFEALMLGSEAARALFARLLMVPASVAVPPGELARILEFARRANGLAP